MRKRIGILGAGSWAIALCRLLTENGHDIAMWEFDPGELALLKEKREHKDKLPGVRIDDSVTVTGEIAAAANGADLIIFAVPAQKTGDVCRLLRKENLSASLAVNVSKGIEVNTLRRMSEVIAEEWPQCDRNAIVTLSGPSHAEEVGKDLPTSVVAAGNEPYCETVQQIFSSPVFRVYSSPDLVGVELGGSLKNIIAIASGIAEGLGFGDNTAGALLTRGLAEITRLAVKLGADPLTLAGLSGIGDLITTCVSQHSRNRYVGYQIGKGKSLDEVLSGMVMVAEGVTTCRSGRALAQKHDIDMPITDAVYRILFEKLPPKEAVYDLMTRPLKAETDIEISL
jgi:glycerol-3-phosphate dehydrogenase (NAD(P)+)